MPIRVALGAPAVALGVWLALVAATEARLGPTVSLVLDSGTVPTPGLEVLSWHEHSLTWRPGDSGTRLRTIPPELVVVHCTGAENPARQVHASLSVRRLSVEFAIDSQGIVWQFLDAARVHAAHVGGLNARSIGIEVVNAVHPIVPNRGGRPVVERVVQVCDPRPGAFPDDWTKDAQGHRLYYRASRRVAGLGLFPAQLSSLRRLVETLCGHLDIPLARADSRDYVPLRERRDLRGVLGHVQVTLRHGDPSLDALEGLALVR